MQNHTSTCVSASPNNLLPRVETILHAYNKGLSTIQEENQLPDALCHKGDKLSV